MSALLLVLMLTVAFPRRIVSLDGLNPAAVPSLSILGSPKGGTTDLYNLIKHFHSGFPQTSAKEDNYEKLAEPISAARVRCMLLCPKNDTRCHQLEGVRSYRDCDKWLNRSGYDGFMGLYPLTIDGNPAQSYYFNTFISIYNKLRNETGANTQFLLTLRDPVTAIPSLFNHWSAGGQIKNGKLEGALRIQFSQLEQPEQWKKLEDISDMVKRGSVDYDKILSLYSSIPKLPRTKEFLLRFIHVIGIIAYTTRLNFIERNFLIIRSENMFEKRFDFFYDELIPFLHPENNSIPYDIVPRKIAEVISKGPLNHKPNYSEVASLSTHMKTKLRRFFDMFPVEPYLYHLQKNNIAKLFPPLQNGSYHHGSWKWG